MSTRDEAEYTAFVLGSRDRLRRTAYLLTGDWALADDLTQDALVRVYVAWPRLERLGGLPTYARRALVSATIDHRRRRWSTERPAEIDADVLTVPDAADALGQRQVLVDCLRALPPRQRACVVLRHLDQLSVEETAAATGCRPGTVKSQTARGLASLRTALDAQGVTVPDLLTTERTTR